MWDVVYVNLNDVEQEDSNDRTSFRTTVPNYVALMNRLLIDHQRFGSFLCILLMPMLRRLLAYNELYSTIDLNKSLSGTKLLLVYLLPFCASLI